MVLSLLTGLALCSGCEEEEEIKELPPPVTYNELVRGCIMATACGVKAYSRVSDCVKAYYTLHLKHGLGRMYDAKYQCVIKAEGDCDEVARCMGTNLLAGRCDSTFKARCDDKSSVSCDLVDKRVFVLECTHAGLECTLGSGKTFDAPCGLGACLSAYKTRCEDGRALSCVNGVITVEDCKAQNMSCGVNAGKTKGCIGNTTTSCVSGRYTEKCEGTKALSCKGGKVNKVDCASRIYNKRCKVHAKVAECAPTGTACTDGFDRCSGEKLQYCLDGNWLTFNCKEAGFGACRTVTNGARCGRTI